MENYSIVIQYFWMIKLVIFLAFIGVLYRTYVVKKLKSKVYNTLSIILLVLFIVQPIKLKIDNDVTYKAQERTIEALKVLPPRVTNDTFKDSVKDLKGISKEDLK